MKLRKDIDIKIKGICFDFKVLGLMILSVVMLSGCSAVNHNGDLDGMWHIERIEKNGETLEHADNLFICLQLDVVQLRKNFICYSGNVHYNYPELKMDFPYINALDGGGPIEEWGFYENPVNFTIMELNRKHLVMKSGDVTVECVRF